MSTVRIATTVAAAAFAVVSQVTPAAADIETPCSAMASMYLAQGAARLSVIGTRITSRGDFGFSSFTMKDGYQLEREPLQTPAGGAQARATMVRVGNEAFSGEFHEVFPERGNGDEDRWSLWFARDGRMFMKSHTWGVDWALLRSTTCYKGSEGQVVVVARQENQGWGTDHFTFLLQRQP